MEKAELRSRAVEAALKLAAETPWDKISLAEIARKADLPLDNFYGELDKDGILSAIDRMLDKACSAEPVSSEDKLRERIFDAAMLRFEAMEEHRAALLSIRKSWKFKPAARLKAAKRRLRTAKWVLTCAEADFEGLAARSLLLAGILFRAENAWEKEDSADFTRTMSQLDRDLRDVDAFAKRVKGVISPKKREKQDAEDGADTVTP